MELKATAGTDLYLGDFVAKKVMGGNGALCAVSFLEMGETSISVCWLLWASRECSVKGGVMSLCIRKGWN